MRDEILFRNFRPTIVKMVDHGFDVNKYGFLSVFYLSDGRSIEVYTDKNICYCDNPFATPQELRLLNDKRALIENGVSEWAINKFIEKQSRGLTFWG